MSGGLARAATVTRRFGHFVAVDRVDLEVGPREVVGLLGANGAGKTTLIRMLLGLLHPSEGAVTLFGEPPSRATRRRLGYVPQGLGLYRDLTPAENLAFARSVFGAGDAGAAGGDGPAGDGTAGGDADADAVAGAGVAGAGVAGAGVAGADGSGAGGTGRHARTVGELPLGSQRRLAFAQALGHHPDLLVLDEPTSGVDPLARSRLWETIGDAAAAGAGVLVTTHAMEEAEECDRLVMLAAGRVVAEGTAAGIVAGATVTIVETDQWAPAFAAVEQAGLAAALVGRTLRVPRGEPDTVRRALGDLPATVRQAPATLEERFFELVAAGDDDPAG